MRQNPRVKKLTTTALMAAVVFVVTYLIRIPMPIASGGYLNLGDVAIYIAAALLGGPGGMAAAAIGSAVADLSAGYVIYIIPTLVVKGMMGLVCGKLMEEMKFVRFLVAAVIGGAIMVGGYAAFETALFNINHALAAVPFNLVQWVVGIAIATAFYPAIPRVKKNLL